jgi:hypothetical protein
VFEPATLTLQIRPAVADACSRAVLRRTISMQRVGESCFSAHSPAKFGSRFSRNARGPSAASFEPMTSIPSFCSMMNA